MICGIQILDKQPPHIYVGVFLRKKNFKWYFNKIIASFILFATLSSGHMPVHFTSPHHKIRFNSQVLIHYCARYFTVVDDFIKQFLCREGLGNVFLVQQTYKLQL